MKKKAMGILLAISCFIIGFAFNSFAKEQLPEITDLWWNDEAAEWEEIEDAYKYEVKLYRGSTEVASQKVTKEKVNFSSKMNKSGTYRFRVRPLGKGDFSDGKWSEYSDTIELTSSDINDKKKTQESNTTTTTTNGNGVQGVNGGPGMGSAAGAWVQDQARWWYRNGDGSYPKTEWKLINEKWYFFDAEGWMKTGWINWNNNTYFCGDDGAMFTNEAMIDNVWYKFDASGAVIAQ